MFRVESESESNCSALESESESEEKGTRVRLESESRDSSPHLCNLSGVSMPDVFMVNIAVLDILCEQDGGAHRC
jgi:hypothetical protein